MKRTLTFCLSLLLGVAFAAPPAEAGSRERKIKKLEKKLADLERNLRSALQFRAKYKTLAANTHFFQSLLRKDKYLLQRVIKYLNSPVSLIDAFLSWVRKDYKKAKKYRGVYNPPSTILWLKCRFGLKAIKARSYYTIRIDIVDAQSGSRIYQSLKPIQRRVVKMLEKIPIEIKGQKVTAGKYQIKVTIEVGNGRAQKRIRYNYKKGIWKPRPRPGTSGHATPVRR